jgi:hypothetical protein
MTEQSLAYAHRRVFYQMELLRSIDVHMHLNVPPSLAPIGSILHSDDSLLGAALQTSHLVSHCLGLAADAYKTVHAVVDFEGQLRVPVAGLYPLLRTAMESSALAIWLLQSDDEQERLSRSIGVRWSDVLYDNAALTHSLNGAVEADRVAIARRDKMLRLNTQSVRKKKSRLRAAANTLKVTIDEQHGRPGFAHIIESAAVHAGVTPGQLRGSWHYFSGLTHPSLSRAMALSDVEATATDNGTLNIQLSADMHVVAWALDASLLTFRAATTLTSSRSNLPKVEWPQKGAVSPPPD